jgi:HEAT repeat protein
VFRAEKHTDIRFRIGAALDRLAPERHGRAVLEAARASLAGPGESNHHPSVAEWMLTRFPAETLPDVVANVSSPGNPFLKRGVVAAAVKVLGKGAAPVLLAVTEHGDPETRLAAVGHLLDLGLHPDVARSAIAAGLAEADAGAVVRFLALASRVDLAALAPRMWPLLEHRSKPVRDAAARTLGRLGEAAVAPAVERLAARKAAIRLAAVGVLALAATPPAIAGLEARLDAEEDQDARDAIYRGSAGGAAWCRAGGWAPRWAWSAACRWA